MKHILSVLLLFLGLSLLAQKGDTLHVQATDLNINGLQTGDYSYLIVFQKARDSPAASMTLAKMTVERKTYHEKPAITVRQQWDHDSVVHKAFTVFDAKDFSTLLHDTYWRRQGYEMIFDFESRTVGFKNIEHAVTDSMKAGYQQELSASFGKYNLNWHDDLIIYSMLPYKANRTFVINYYDPGFGKPEEVPYTVTGSDVLTDRGGASIECWVLEHDDEHGGRKVLDLQKDQRGAKRGRPWRRVGIPV